MKTVVLGMSGGVDSSVAALLLKNQGYKVIGLFMKNWEESQDSTPLQKGCTAAQDYEDVVRTCSLLDIPYMSVNFSAQYKELVFKEFIEDYQAGYTPNPDVLCNREIKFKVFFEYAKSLGADYVATGHYARIDAEGRLMKALDLTKDQSYFLSLVDKHVFKNVLFPLGELLKTQVRQIARENAIPTQDKKDSTGICFVGDRNFPQFLSTYIKPKPGPFVDLDGHTVGKHMGCMFYTLGQRRHLGLGGPGARWFVVKKDLANNVVYVTRGADHPLLYSKSLIAENLNWLGSLDETLESFMTAKIRYRQIDETCYVTELNNNEINVQFANPQRSIAPGQIVVFYRNDYCLGGARIKKPGEPLSNEENKEKCATICPPIDNFVA